MTLEQILGRLEEMGSTANVEGMARYGIRPEQVLGVPIADLRKLARELGRGHELALELWESGIHEARLLAALIAEPRRVDSGLMERWAASFDNWALCDTTCGSLFRKAAPAWEQAREWCGRDEMYVKRAGYAMIAWLAVHDKQTPDSTFTKLFPLIRSGSRDERPLVRKAVNWALRQIGKRNVSLNARAIELAVRLAENGDANTRRVANRALRELTGSKVQQRLAAAEGRG